MAAQVKATLERSLGEPLSLLFASVDPEALASASIAQVIRQATLRVLLLLLFCAVVCERFSLSREVLNPIEAADVLLLLT